MPAAGACDVRHSDLGIRGLQLRWVATATHDVAVPPEFVALYCLPQLPDVVLRAFHRLLPHQGDVGFFIVTLDFIGYTGTVVVLVFKEFFNPDINWLDFYNLMSAMSALCAAWLSYARLSTWCSAIARRMLRDRWTLPFPFAPLVPAGQFLAS